MVNVKFLIVFNTITDIGVEVGGGRGMFPWLSFSGEVPPLAILAVKIKI